MGVLEGYEKFEVVVIRSEYFCNSCGQFRSSYLPIYKTKNVKIVTVQELLLLLLANWIIKNSNSYFKKSIKENLLVVTILCN